MTKHQKYTTVQSDGIDVPEVYTHERGWLGLVSCTGVYEPGMLYKVQAVTWETRVSFLKTKKVSTTQALIVGKLNLGITLHMISFST